MLAATGLYSHIYNNQIKSVALLLAFPLLLIGMIGAFFGGLDLWQQGPRPVLDWVHSWTVAKQGMILYAPIAVGVASVWFLFAYFFEGPLMRLASGSHKVTRTEEPRLYNLLETLCISRGIAMPRLEVMETTALNAFAAGVNEKSYRIVVTRGLIETLQDDELEAVLAHELSHILHRDARLLVIAAIFVGIISFLAQMLWRTILYGGVSVRSERDDRRRNGGVALIFGLVVLMIGYVFAIVLRFALSRRREYLADAGAVDLTKNPEAMMRALLRIRGHAAMPGMPGQVREMCIENAHGFLGLFMTHPPIEDRVATLSRLTRTPIPEFSQQASSAPSRRVGPWG